MNRSLYNYSLLLSQLKKKWLVGHCILCGQILYLYKVCIYQDRNEEGIFLPNISIGIQNTYSCKFSYGQSTFETPFDTVGNFAVVCFF